MESWNTLHSSPIPRKPRQTGRLTRWRVGPTLHHSSPLFTQVSATTHKGGIRQIQLPSLLFLLEFDEQIRQSLLDLRERGGEEWWRVVKSCRTSSPRQTPCLSGVARDRWRVKSISISSLPVRSRTAKIPPVKIYTQNSYTYKFGI